MTDIHYVTNQTALDIPRGTILVKIGMSTVGKILEVEGGYQYFPKGQKDGGEIYSSLKDLKRSLEEE